MVGLSLRSRLPWASGDAGHGSAPPSGASERAAAADDPMLAAPLGDVERELGSSGKGLASAEAASRLERYGPNALREKRDSTSVLLLKQFWGPIPWMIEAALVLAAALSDIGDVAVIGAMLLANGFLGFWQEHQAGNAIEALKQRLSRTAEVLRDGAWQEVEASALVPGDVVRLRLGDVVPADARLLEDCELELDQSALTGESLPVAQSSGGVAYSGSVVNKGEGDALVVATGSQSFFGRTAELVATASTTSHFQRAVLAIGRYLIVFAVTFVVVTLVVGLVRGNPVGDMVEFALVLVIAGVPVALPAVLSVTMAIGAGRLAKRDVVVAHLPAVEELSGTDILCSDKTGTLTQNRLSVGEPVCLGDGGRVPAQEVILAAALASREEDRDPIDLAVLAALDGGLDGYRVVDFTPFDPVRKLSQASATTPDGAALEAAKGAPQAIAALVTGERRSAVQERVTKAVDEFAAHGYRALAVAERQQGKEWEVLGVLPLSDPPRPDSRETLEAARALGVDVKMVTGDHVAIAREVASEVGLSTDIVGAGELEGMEGEALSERVEKAGGFAQVFPEHKFAIVKALQAREHIVGMTGDGVNDAPALKQADVGIAVSGATDAARAAADIVLLTPGLSVIVEGLRTSRQIFARMMSYAIYRICDTISLLLFVGLVVIASNEQPVTAIMILLVVVLNDAAILTIAYDRAPAATTPRAWQMRTILGVSTVLGVFLMGAFLAAYYVAAGIGLELDQRQTFLYLVISVLGHLTIFSTRVRGSFVSLRPAGILVVAVVGTQALAVLIALLGLGIVEPLAWTWALAAIGVSLVGFVVEDRIKLLAYRLLERPSGVLPKLLHGRA